MREVKSKETRVSDWKKNIVFPHIHHPQRFQSKIHPTSVIPDIFNRESILGI